MAEAMTVETIVEAEWQLQRYWTRLRFPFQTAKGAWSDVDVLAYHPEKRHLVIAESKVRGPTKKQVYAYTTQSREKEGNILAYDKDTYFSFLKNIESLCKDGVIFDHFEVMVEILTIQLVSNYYIDHKNKRDARETVLARIKEEKYVPSGVKIEVKLDSTLEVILRILEQEDKDQQGFRYGHPMLDIAREFNRYLHPDISNAGSKEATEEVKKEIWDRIRQAFAER